MNGGSDADYDALCTWIVEPCFPYFLECIIDIPTDLTFGAFYYPLTYYLKLLVSESSLYAKATRDRHTINPFALMLPSLSLPQSPNPSFKRIISPNHPRHCRYLRLPLRTLAIRPSSPWNNQVLYASVEQGSNHSRNRYPFPYP
jgi:hypothetical protein